MTRRRAIVYINGDMLHDLLTIGVTIPPGYRFVDLREHPLSGSWAAIVESDDLPECFPGNEYPMLQTYATTTRRFAVDGWRK